MATIADADPLETQEWRDALDGVLEFEGAERAQFLLEQVLSEAHRKGAPRRRHPSPLPPPVDRRIVLVDRIHRRPTARVAPDDVQAPTDGGSRGVVEPLGERGALLPTIHRGVVLQKGRSASETARHVHLAVERGHDDLRALVRHRRRGRPSPLGGA